MSKINPDLIDQTEFFKNTYGVAQDKGYSQEFLNPSNKIAITPTTGSNFASYGNSFYYIIGNRVHIHLGLQGLTAGTLNNIFVMPNGLRPSYPLCALGVSGDTSLIASANIGENGQIAVNPQNYGYAMIDIEYDYV